MLVGSVNLYQYRVGSSMRRIFAVAFAVLGIAVQVARGELDIVFEYSETIALTAEQRAALDSNLWRAEKFWEGVISGYTASDETIQFPIRILPQSTGLAAASANDPTESGEFVVPTRGDLFINASQILPSTTGFGLAPMDVNVLDELMAHEIAHALGMGSLWQINGAAERGSGQYTGAFGLAAFREEFQGQEMAEFIPLESAGGNSSADVHWDQLFRSSPQEGNPDDPLSLSPLIGIVDFRGRDIAQDLMSPALDPDFGEPFFSNTTIQAFRDIGYDVVESYPTSLCDFDNSGQCDAHDIDALSQSIRDDAFSEQFDVYGDGVVDSLDRNMMLEWHMDLIPGDADLNDVVDFLDFLALSTNFGQEGGWAEGDFDGDGTVRFPDFLTLSTSFGQTLSHAAIAPVPEPTGFATTGLAVVMAMLAARRRFS